MAEDQHPEEAYEPGSIKRHPEWPLQKFLAVRTIFKDADFTACTSWLRISPTVGTTYVTHAQVGDWPDVENPVTAAP